MRWNFDMAQPASDARGSWLTWVHAGTWDWNYYPAFDFSTGQSILETLAALTSDSFLCRDKQIHTHGAQWIERGMLRLRGISVSRGYQHSTFQAGVTVGRSDISSFIHGDQSRYSTTNSIVHTMPNNTLSIGKILSQRYWILRDISCELFSPFSKLFSSFLCDFYSYNFSLVYSPFNNHVHILYAYQA